MNDFQWGFIVATAVWWFLLVLFPFLHYHIRANNAKTDAHAVKESISSMIKISSALDRMSEIDPTGSFAGTPAYRVFMSHMLDENFDDALEIAEDLLYIMEGDVENK